jgi:protein-disulfide isomerase
MRTLSLAMLGMLLGCATADQVKVLEQRVDQLEMLVDRQSEHPSIVINADGSTTEATKPTVGAGGNDDEARVLLQDIQGKIRSGEASEAKTLLEILRTKHGGTPTYQSKTTQRLEQELAVVGTKVKSSDISGNIDSWFIEGDINLEKGVTLVVFWEVWCPHCTREVPKLKATYATYRDKGLQIVALTRMSKSSTEEKVLSFIQDNELTYPVAKENGQVAPRFNVSGIPAAAVVRDGVIVWRGNPAGLSDAAWKQWI